MINICMRAFEGRCGPFALVVLVLVLAAAFKRARNQITSVLRGGYKVQTHSANHGGAYHYFVIDAQTSPNTLNIDRNAIQNINKFVHIGAPEK